MFGKNNEDEDENFSLISQPIVNDKRKENEIAELLFNLEKAPEYYVDLSEIQKEGQIFWEKSRSQICVEGWANLNGDRFSIFTKQNGVEKWDFSIEWVHMFNIQKEDNFSSLLESHSSWRINLFSSGFVLSIAFSTNRISKSWRNLFAKLLNLKYSQQEYIEKQNIISSVIPLIEEQKTIKENQIQMVMDMLKNTGFSIAPKSKKLREGYLELRKSKKQWKSIYCALFTDFLYLFKPHEKVSVRNFKLGPFLNREPYDWIEIKYIVVIKHSKLANAFFIQTLLRKFTFRSKHEIAAEEWMSDILVAKEGKKAKTLLPKSDDMNEKDYFYKKDINGKIILTITSMGKVKTKKLPKGDLFGIGRSSKNAIYIEDDEHVSRSHARIIIEDNVPYIVDLGSPSGTKLNNDKILKAPLKPNDVIKVAHTHILFNVKKGDLIFGRSDDEPTPFN